MTLLLRLQKIFNLYSLYSEAKGRFCPCFMELLEDIKFIDKKLNFWRKIKAFSN
jgi:hypothetical protein